MWPQLGYRDRWFIAIHQILAREEGGHIMVRSEILNDLLLGVILSEQLVLDSVGLSPLVTLQTMGL